MSQCGCGDTDIREVHRLAGTEASIGIQKYYGCRECFEGPGVMLYLLNPKGLSDWVMPGIEAREISPDEFGGNEGRGIRVPIFEIKDLVKATQTLIDTGDIADMEDYAGIEDWLSDYGLAVVQEAMRICGERMKP